MGLLPFTWFELRQLKKKPVIVLIVSVICLIGINFLTNAGTLPLLFRMIQGKYYVFLHFMYWAVASIFFYVALPVCVVKFLFRERLSDYGLKWQVFFGYYKIYLLAFLFILPLIVIVSYSPQFQSAYPFYVPQQEGFVPYYFIWEGFYVLQFFALEFFFRGFMVHGLKADMGLYAVFIMVVPYCMIHFGKPLPECAGSILAGIFLGLMSYKTKSIGMGALLHSVVGLTMNWLSLWQRGYL